MNPNGSDLPAASLLGPLVSDKWPPLFNAVDNDSPPMPFELAIDGSEFNLVQTENSARPPPKIGPRFSKEAVRILRTWMARHESHPYPTPEERATLELQTGLTNTQVYNWLANARRRRPKCHSSDDSIFQQVPSSTAPVNLPARPGTPMIGASPMQRWMDSPPEDDPAAAEAIAKALESALSSVQNSANGEPTLDDGSNRFSSSKNVGSSHSNTSSVVSTPSGASWNSSNSIRRYGRNRTNKKRQPRRPDYLRRKPLTDPVRLFQCTFCTDTFSAKYDWQRHEKSLHVPVERWKCCPDQSRLVHTEDGMTCCIFCGENNPDGLHMDSHNPNSCKEREFTRKDHLKQHLRLVHNGKLIDSFQKYWKAADPVIVSRCGFCGITLDSWTFRAGHLADHFKMGQCMSEWKGDWGFDQFVLDSVENAMPPYLIGIERSTPLPHAASRPAVELPSCAFEMVKLELLWFIHTYKEDNYQDPDCDSMLLEACRIIFAAESITPEDEPSKHHSSWLRDVIISQESIALQAKLGPLRYGVETGFSFQRTRAQYLFERCPLEYQLRQYVSKAWQSGQIDVSDAELQAEACRAILRIDREFPMPSDSLIATWLIQLVTSSTSWLKPFRDRMHTMVETEQETRDNGGEGRKQLAFTSETVYCEDGSNLPIIQDQGLLTSQDLGCAQRSLVDSSHNHLDRDTDPTSAISAGQRSPWVTSKFVFVNDAKLYQWLNLELRRWAMATMSPNNPTSHIPSDAELRHQTRCIMFDDDNNWNWTPADNAEWLQQFKRGAGISD